MTDAKRYAIECYGGGEGLGAPALAVFDLDRETADFIVTMAHLIRQHQIHKIERYDFRVWYFETDPRDDLDDPQRTAADADPGLIGLRNDDQTLMRSEADRLCVTADRFRFLTYRKHCGEEIETAGQSIAALAAHFDIPWEFGNPDGGVLETNAQDSLHTLRFSGFIESRTPPSRRSGGAESRWRGRGRPGLS